MSNRKFHCPGCALEAQGVKSRRALTHTCEKGNKQVVEHNFYCQKKCGAVDFSIKEWNKTQQEIKTLTPEQLDFVMQPETICQQQCNSCMTIVTQTREKNSKITPHGK